MSAASDLDVVERLLAWANQKPGEFPPNNWGPPLSDLLREAAGEIVRLRTLLWVPTGQSFRDITKGVPRRSMEEIKE